MNKKLMLLVGALVVVFVVIFLINRGGQEVVEVPGSDANSEVTGTVKEFAMTAFYEVKDGKTLPQFSLDEITVAKGDQVRIKVTNTKGMHDFTLDEFSVSKELPLDQEVTIEFTADKTGEFVYYCAKPGHRAGGQWGTLKVTE